mmetsp:Transcript_16989/g.25673  ORF Transcript_16989/g.25673 Transcript_16989/m.25673 type:complete len:228 (+) Transcript_16989:48-731(+)|eukprot:CAMPEP_0194763088 /NCGR_PEP_ID=MMETSP0323_2-20130528/17967_1 /TAXON_ID=2866 ORGANISM="Crypthecodinium cohnii, Strain Seligo" /NCGR_SAMPLE_ID=MMETSP0323_2 /ASSEMBLY_ACC=CAM_ASM_000346 /LENGTH=227 /DNA_ID=CAMNT_0039687061 /DNA_START=47 /DNA_END=730 /DNA_ORIENTATION=-
MKKWRLTDESLLKSSGGTAGQSLNLKRLEGNQSLATCKKHCLTSPCSSALGVQLMLACGQLEAVASSFGDETPALVQVVALEEAAELVLVLAHSPDGSRLATLGQVGIDCRANGTTGLLTRVDAGRSVASNLTDQACSAGILGLLVFGVHSSLFLSLQLQGIEPASGRIRISSTLAIVCQSRLKGGLRNVVCENLAHSDECKDSCEHFVHHPEGEQDARQAVEWSKA